LPRRQRDLLRRLAARYLWWETVERALRHPDQIVAQTMALGDFADVLELERRLGRDRMRRVLLRAAPGQFDERSWAFWHYRLGLARPEQVPQRPRRTFA